MPNVYIVNKSCHDFSPAERFGHLVFMTEGTINRYAVSLIFRKFKRYMADAGPDDYILITGMSTMLVVACAIFAARFKRLNLLLYKSGRYLERTIILEEAKGENKNVC